MNSTDLNQNHAQLNLLSLIQLEKNLTKTHKIKELLNIQIISLVFLISHLQNKETQWSKGAKIAIKRKDLQTAAINSEKNRENKIILSKIQPKIL